MRNTSVLLVLAALIFMMRGEPSNGTETASGEILAETTDPTSLRKRFANGEALVFRGGDCEAAAILGIDSSKQGDQPDKNSPEYFAVQQLPGGLLRRAYFYLQTPSVEKFTVAAGSGKTTTVEPRGPAPLDEATRRKALESMLLDIQNWAANPPDPALPPSSDGFDKQDVGDWNYITDTRWQYEGWFNNRHRATLTLTARGYKIRDGMPGNDWYLLETELHHQIHDYVQDFPSLGSTGHVGWYVQDRYMSFQTTEWISTLAKYGPAGTISSGQATISIGGDINTGAAGVNAGYSKSYAIPDITIHDSSSYVRNACDWREAFTCPRGSYSLYPAVNWPCATSKGSFPSYQCAIYSTTDTLNGIRLMLNPYAELYKDGITNHGITYEVTRHFLDMGGIEYVTLYKNYAPDPPNTPSGPVEAFVNTPVMFTTNGTDHDGDALTFRFDWGDGAPSGFSGRSRVHTWTAGREYGVRTRSKDAPAGAVSDDSPSFRIFIKEMIRAEIEGPDAVSEGASGIQYNAKAYFNDTTATNDSALWTIVTGAAFATINAAGQLTAGRVSRDEYITLEATVINHGITKTHRKTVLVRNSAQLPPQPDLKARLDAISPSHFAAGEPLHVTGAVVNAGDCATTCPFWIEMRLVNLYTGRQVYLCDSIAMTNPIAAGASVDIGPYFPRQAYSIPKGLYRVEMWVDAVNQVSEWCETDNCSAGLRVEVMSPTRATEWLNYR